MKSIEIVYIMASCWLLSLQVIHSTEMDKELSTSHTHPGESKILCMPHLRINIIMAMCKLITLSQAIQAFVEVLSVCAVDVPKVQICCGHLLDLAYDTVCMIVYLSHASI